MEQAPHWRIREWFKGYKIDERAFERLRIYHTELLRWTKKINLISPGTVNEADRIHFADGIYGSLIVAKNLGANQQVWDFGSGNGIPGVVLAILKPETGVTCLDSDERKSGFIKQLSLRLELDNLAARAARVESLGANSVSCAMARGFAPLEKGLPLVSKAMKSGGVFFNFKGQEWPTELAAVSPSVSSTWNTSFLEAYDLPNVSSDKTVKPETRVILKSLKK